MGTTRREARQLVTKHERSQIGYTIKQREMPRGHVCHPPSHQSRVRCNSVGSDATLRAEPVGHRPP